VKRRLVCLVISTVATLGGTVGASTSAVAAKGGCPDGYSPVRASRYGDAGRAVDKNGDGWVCDKPIPAQPEGSFNVIDNNAKG
jgi:hypothetical protein